MQFAKQRNVDTHEKLKIPAEPFVSDSGRMVFLNAYRYQIPLASIFFSEPWTAAPPDTAENQSAAVTDVNSPRSDMWAGNPWQP